MVLLNIIRASQERSKKSYRPLRDWTCTTPGLLTALLDSSTVGPDFPELPPAPSFPCPFITDEEIATYLPPLYARGWTVQPSDPKAAKKPAPELVKRFVFSAHETLEAFLHLDLLDITESENVRDDNLTHTVSLRAHSRATMQHHAWRDITPDPPSMVVRVHTHSGLRPARDAEEPRRARVQPGITLRDVRFAYLLEQRLAARGGTAERAGAENVPWSEEQPLSAAEVEARRGLPGNE